MEMPTNSRLAYLKRIQAAFGNRQTPKGWGDLSLTEQLHLGSVDPELCLILKDQMTADLELKVMSGCLEDQGPELEDPAVAYQQAQEEAIQKMNDQMAEMRAQKEQREAAAENARRVSWMKA